MDSDHFRIAIIGTGFAGLGMAIRLKQQGHDDFVLLERAGDVGGTWRDNSYPGCQCDVPSHLYSFSFAPNPGWSRTFSHQQEIWDYLRDCTRRFDITPHIRFDHDVREAAWDDEAGIWRLETAQGSLTADVVVSGAGGLSEPSFPDVPGLESFEGEAFHSAQWNHDFDLKGKRVAVVGTGASAIQFVPRIQPQVESLHVFQRTPPWVLPHPDRSITKRERRIYRRFPFAQKLVRSAIYWARETFVIYFLHTRFAALPERIGRRHLAKQVPDRELRRKLRPAYRFGCKRPLISNDYYPSLTRPNVDVITHGIAEVRGNTVVAADGSEREVDAVIFGTGFRIQDMPVLDRVRGRDGRTLRELWNPSMQAYAGTTIAGLPNFFMLLGPNTGLGHNSVVFMIEAQIAYVVDALRTMDARNWAQIEVREDAVREYNADVQDRLRDTVWTAGGCASWYHDASGRNTTIWPGPSFRFRERIRRFDPAPYVAVARADEPEPAADAEPVAA
jgi:cation diffusion facilitator CzcD-associated flavoprotein CzcO